MFREPPPGSRWPVLAAAGALSALLWAGCATQGHRAATTPPPPPPPPQAPTVSTPAPPPAPEKPAEKEYAALQPLEGDGWEPLFDGRSLEGWTVTEFAGKGEVKLDKGLLTIDEGAMLSGVSGRTNALPKCDYEIALDAMRVRGSDFFCGFTFPVGDSCCSLIVGGWGGGVVGISSLDGNDASSNETTKYMSFDSDKWYRIRVRVTQPKIEAWIGKQKVVDVNIAGRKISMRPGEIEMQAPFGICTYQTAAAIREIQWRSLK